MAVRRLAALAAAAALAACGGGTPGALHGGSPSPPGVRAKPTPALVAVTDPTAVFDLPPAGRPGYLQGVRLPPFNTVVERLVGDPGETLTVAGAQGRWGSNPRQHYSLDEPWNATGTLIAIDNSGGTPKRLYLDGETYAVRYGSCPGTAGGDDRWNPIPADANQRIEVLADGRTLEWIDVTTCAVTRSWRLPMAVIGIGHFKGNPSDDGRFLALGDESSMFVVDMLAWPAIRIGPVVNLRNGCEWACVARNLTVSPSGRYVLVGYEGDARRVFDLDPQTLSLVPHPMPESATWPGCQGSATQGFVHGAGHADLARDPDQGEDVLVGQDNVCTASSRPAGLGSVLKVRLRDGKVTSLTDPSQEASAWFVSCRNTARPGWCYVTYRWQPQPAHFNGEVVAVKLDGSRSVERLAQTRTINTDNPYDDQPHAVPSRDGSRVIFASDWEQACASACGSKAVAQAYVIDTRAPAGS